ncbi:MAG: O-antigen ligase family protein [Selenomonadaceae bacterium]|nr:O-antigen ligase family protein [Selenomonadaceae bacterium]
MINKILNIDKDKALFNVVLVLAASINFSTAVSSIAVGIGILVIAHKFLNSSYPKEFMRVFMIYFVIQFIIAMLSTNPLVSLREFGGELHRCLPFFFTLLCITSEMRLKKILVVILTANIINDLFGVYQWFVLDIPRPSAFNHTATFFGSMLLIQLPVHLFIAKSTIMPKTVRKLAGFSCLLTVFALSISLTRGAWLAFVIVGSVFIFFEMPSKKSFLIFFCTITICLTVAAMMSPLFLRTIKTFSDPYYSSNTERILMWQSSWEMFKDYPLHGVGQEMFFKFYNEQYISPEALDRPGKDMRGHTHPHSNIFKNLSEGGLLGIIAFAILYGYFFRKFYILYRREHSYAGLMAFLILLGLQLEGLTDTNMNQVPIMREYWLLTGIFLSPVLTHCKS